MLITFVRSIILYVIVLVVMRLMGKREIGQLQPFELAIAIMIADLASVPMSEVGIPISLFPNSNNKWYNSYFKFISNAFNYFFYKFKKHKNETTNMRET